MFSECFNMILFWVKWKSGCICSKFFQTKTNSAARNRTLGNQLLMSLCTGLDYKGFSEEVLGLWEFPLPAQYKGKYGLIIRPF